MPICIECRYPVHQLYTAYKAADDRSLGKGVRLTQCPRCKRFADKYVEHDFVVLFIDLVLIKPQVYRHLLFNRLERNDDRFNPSIIRFGILLLLFDVYLTWARIEKSTANGHHDASQQSFLSTQPLFLQYLFFLCLCALNTVAFHLPIRLLCAHPPRAPAWVGRKLPFLVATTSATSPTSPSTAPGAGPAVPLVPSFSPTTLLAKSPKMPSSAASSANSASPAMPPNSTLSPPSLQVKPPSPETIPMQSPSNLSAPDKPAPSTPSLNHFQEPIPLLPYYPHPAPLSTALLVSSCTKLFPILLLIWNYDMPSSASAVSWAVILNNVAALDILMDCGFARAAVLVGAGAAAREVAGRTALGLVGLRGWRSGIAEVMTFVDEVKAAVLK